MAAEEHSPGLGALVGRLARTGLGALNNRIELFALEWQEEKTRLTEMFFWTTALVFLSVMVVLLLTAVVIFLFREEWRIYVAGGFAALYFIGAVVAVLVVRGLLKREPFTETVDQARKDRAWLESLK
ncbi:MAG TPA: phage holin family protein [Verrucomicrobiae bacterium]|nr:phage holin family protein [Verrucomicrobiae bacterium]